MLPRDIQRPGHRHGVCLPPHGAVSIEDVARVAGLIREHQSAFA